MTRKFISIISAALLAACAPSENEPKVLMFVDTGPEVWHSGESLEFVPDSLRLKYLDSKDNVTLSLILRYTGRSATASVPLEIITESYLEPQRRDTVCVLLFDKNGYPTGRGSYSVYEYSKDLWHGTLPDGIQVSVTPLADTQGIISAGISLR